MLSSTGSRPAIEHDLDVYGLLVRVDGDWPEVVAAVREDFAWFAGDGPRAPMVRITVHRRPPDHARLGAMPQSFITTRNVVFQLGRRTVIDYGHVLGVYDRERDWLELEGEDEHLVHEAAYLFLLSRVGRHLDARGLTRVHALGLAGRSGGLLVLLPSGGGKTTLGLRALREPGVTLISEDTPVLDRRGLLHPFPLRIGINESDRELVPPGELRRIERLEYGPKLLLSVSAFAERVEREAVPLRHVVLGRRWLAGGGELHPLPRRAAISPLLRDAVVGLGVAQMIEYVLQRGPVDFLAQGRVAASRARCCARALAGAQVWRLELARDGQRNWEALQPLLAATPTAER